MDDDRARRHDTLLLRAPDRFGLCRECGEPIEVHRLERVPWPSLCASCARLAEDPPAP